MVFLIILILDGDNPLLVDLCHFVPWGWENLHRNHYHPKIARSAATLRKTGNLPLKMAYWQLIYLSRMVIVNSFVGLPQSIYGRLSFPKWELRMVFEFPNLVPRRHDVRSLSFTKTFFGLWVEYSHKIPANQDYSPLPSAWWFRPLWKILVSWDDYSQYMGKKHVPNHQPAFVTWWPVPLNERS